MPFSIDHGLASKLMSLLDRASPQDFVNFNRQYGCAMLSHALEKTIPVAVLLPPQNYAVLALMIGNANLGFPLDRIGGPPHLDPPTNCQADLQFGVDAAFYYPPPAFALQFHTVLYRS